MKNIIESIYPYEVKEQFSGKYGKTETDQGYLAYLKMKDSYKLAKDFGYDPNISVGIIMGFTYGKPIYGKYGEEFLKSIEPNYSKTQYGKDMVKKLLIDCDQEKVNLICEGIDNVLNGNYQSGEEQISGIVKHLYDEIENLPEPYLPIASLKYCKKLEQKVEESGVITQISFGEEFNKKKSQLAQKERTFDKNIVTNNMRTFYEYYLQHQNEIPDGFKKGFESLTPQALTAHYLASRGERYIERFVQEQSKKSDNDKTYEI